MRRRHLRTGFLTGALPRTGKLTKDLSHLSVNFSRPKKNLIGIEIHHGSRKNVATLRTVRTLINNLIIGVTKGFKYKMRYVYAHFPINVNLDKNKETGLFEVEIRNFIGEKIVRRVVMQPGVDLEISKAQKDELILMGNSLEGVSQSAADIQQICRVRNKDIRKAGFQRRTPPSTPFPPVVEATANSRAVPRRYLRLGKGQHCPGLGGGWECSFCFRFGQELRNGNHQHGILRSVRVPTLQAVSQLKGGNSKRCKTSKCTCCDGSFRAAYR